MAKLAASGGVNMPTAPTAAAPAEVRYTHNYHIDNLLYRILKINTYSLPLQEIPAIATACFMLSNMFDPSKENEAGWADDVRVSAIYSIFYCSL